MSTKTPTEATKAAEVATTTPATTTKKVSLGKVELPQPVREALELDVEIDAHKSVMSLGEGQVRTYVPCSVTKLVFRLLKKGSFQRRTRGQDINQVEVDLLGTREGSTVEEVLFQSHLTWGQDYDFRGSKAKTDEQLIKGMPKEDLLVVNTDGSTWPKTKVMVETKEGPKPYYNLTPEALDLKKLVSNFVVDSDKYNSEELNLIVNSIPTDLKSEEEKRRKLLDFRAEETERIGKAMGQGNAFAGAGFSGNA